MTDRNRAAIRGIMYDGDKVPGLGWARTADSIAVDGIVDAAAFGDAGAGKGDFTAAMQYRPGQTDPNRVKRGNVVSGDKWTHQQADYSDALTDLAYEAVGYVHPDVLNECIRLALRFIYFQTYMPLTPWQDGDFASASLTSPYSWTANAVGTVPTKDTTTERNPTSGKRSLVLTGAGYVPTSSLYVTPGDRLVHGCDSSAETGATFTYSLYDVTHSRALYTNSHAVRAMQHIIHADTIPDGCTEVQARLATAGGVSVVETTFGHLTGAEQRNLIVPSSINEAWRLLGFGPADYGRSTGQDRFNASSRRRTSLARPFDYDLYPLLEEATPYTLQVDRHEGLAETDHWYYVMRPFSDSDELTDEDGVTDAPEDLLMASVYYQLALVMCANYRTDPRWPALRDLSAATLAAQKKARETAPPRGEQQPAYIPGGRGGGYASPDTW